MARPGLDLKAPVHQTLIWQTGARPRPQSPCSSIWQIWPSLVRVSVSELCTATDTYTIEEKVRTKLLFNVKILPQRIKTEANLLYIWFLENFQPCTQPNPPTLIVSQLHTFPHYRPIQVNSVTVSRCQNTVWTLETEAFLDKPKWFISFFEKQFLDPDKGKPILIAILYQKNRSINFEE